MYLIPVKIDWEKTFVDPELIREEEKVNKITRGGNQFTSDPFKFNQEMDGFLKITDSMNNLEMNSFSLIIINYIIN